MTQSPNQSLDSFVRLFDETPNSTIEDRRREAMSDPAAMQGRFDAAIRGLSVDYGTQMGLGLGFRKRQYEQAMSAITSLGGAWTIGYVSARAVYGTAMTTFRYSGTETEAKANAQRIVHFQEGMDSLDPLRQRHSLRSLGMDENKVLIRKLGRREAENTLLLAMELGTGCGIAEHELFIRDADPSPVDRGES
jgi:hypothetical protein